MKRKLEAVIFDFDGVIADTVHLYYIATKRIADELQVPFSIEDNLRYQGVPRMVMMQDLKNRNHLEISDEEMARLGNKRNEYYQELIADFSPEQMLPGIFSFLNQLKEAGLKIALASSSSNAPYLLKKLQIYSLFDAIVDPHSLTNGKPDPEIFVKAADAVGVCYENCAAIEDGEAGLSGILKTPMFSVGVGDVPFMKKADWYVKSTQDLCLEGLYTQFINKI
ncbi:beta-phosphoglucomutase [Bacillus sp. 03113]|uniref:beta-phosphoglucomutase n=1 Tax=Bacillus sp. 03113 TaxID=2578211 RepID=UPI0011421A4C|nr:beta-phosphoglucomutase [Bacillus sp. 03113]